jgi:hypothetical protein
MCGGRGKRDFGHCGAHAKRKPRLLSAKVAPRLEETLRITPLLTEPTPHRLPCRFKGSERRQGECDEHDLYAVNECGTGLLRGTQPPTDARARQSTAPQSSPWPYTLGLSVCGSCMITCLSSYRPGRHCCPSCRPPCLSYPLFVVFPVKAKFTWSKGIPGVHSSTYEFTT